MGIFEVISERPFHAPHGKDLTSITPDIIRDFTKLYGVSCATTALVGIELSESMKVGILIKDFIRVFK